MNRGSISCAGTRPGTMKIFGLMCVRNEADILETNIRYHLALGLCRILVVDNGSCDGTDRVLGNLTRSLPVDWCRREGEFRQGNIISHLAHEAYLRGADWLVPIDADEFWYAPERPFQEILRDTTAGALIASVVNYIQRRDQAISSASALLTMTRRPAEPQGPLAKIEELVTTRNIGFVEIEYPPKCLARASSTTKIGQGNHWVEFVPGEQVRTEEIVCLHALIRSRAQLDRKANVDRKPEDLRHQKRLAWHRRWWEKLGAEGRLDEEWAANSYDEETLDVGGRKRRTVYDPTLRNAVAPWVARSSNPQLAQPDPVEALKLCEWIPDEFVVSVLDRVETIEGWLKESEAALLMAVTTLSLLERPEGAIVEIGSYCGKSTVAIGSAARMITDEARVFAIDPHEGFVGAGDTHDGVFATHSTLETFRTNIREAGLEKIVRPLVMHSYEVKWTEPIGMLFIDGLHDFENVSRDYSVFADSLCPGCIVLFDDYDIAFPGVVRFVDQKIESGALDPVTRVGKIMVTRKPRHQLGDLSLAGDSTEDVA